MGPPAPAGSVSRLPREPSGHSAAAHEVRAVRVAVVGVSVSPTCGMRAHAGLLSEALRAESVLCSDHWLMREEGSLGAGRSVIREWTRALAAELTAEQPDAILLHYSVFSSSYRGFPVYVRPLVAALRATGIPVLAFMHELAYPWGLGGWRGRAWALTHRAVLRGLVGACAAIVVTTDFREEWLASRRWLPARPLGFAPVFSNLPPPAARPRGAGGARVLGLFGYSYDAGCDALVLDAVSLLAERGFEIELRLLGAPGRQSPLAESWLAKAAARGLEQALTFAGPLPPQELSDALAACEVLLFADSTGPSCRKGTVAGALASGRPMVATDGPRTWRALLECEAAQVVPARAAALADAVAALLADEASREALGARGRAFAEGQMGVERSAQVVAGLLRAILSARTS